MKKKDWPEWAGARWPWRGWVYRPTTDRLHSSKRKRGDHFASVGCEGGRFGVTIDGYRLPVSFESVGRARRVAKVILKELAR